MDISLYPRVPGDNYYRVVFTLKSGSTCGYNLWAPSRDVALYRAGVADYQMGYRNSTEVTATTVYIQKITTNLIWEKA